MLKVVQVGVNVHPPGTTGLADVHHRKTDVYHQNLVYPPYCALFGS